MQDTHFIVREPLLNNQERVFGYELGWQDIIASGRKPTEDEALALVQFVAEHLGADGSTSLLGEQSILLEVAPRLLAGDALALLPPRGTVLAVRADDVRDDAAIAAVIAAHARGYSVSLRDARPEALDERLLKAVSYLELNVRAPDFVASVQQYHRLNRPSVHLVARGVDSWKIYDACASHGMFVAGGHLPLTPRHGPGRGMNPAQALILQLMEMVRKNADIKQLEDVLKRDAALSYKLLRYINSAGFGLGCEIQSLRHAVTMLGYAPLQRWLALLLTTATGAAFSPVLMQTAVIRGRFSELLGAGFLPRHEAENLFVAGMFSLLDKLLGVPMEQVLEQIQLSESVTRALLAREGIYGPFVALAEACESNVSDLDAMATSLCIGAAQVNQAQMAALAWTQALRL